MDSLANDVNCRQWAVLADKRYRSCARTVEELPAGGYNCEQDMDGSCYFTRRHLELDALIDFPDSLPARILQEIETFWSIGHRFEKYGLLHRRGYLLHGKQGCGKSSVIHLLVSRVTAAGNVVFFCDNPYSFVSALSEFREAEPDRPALCIFEDIDRLVGRQGDPMLLQWLDGNSQVNKVVNIATTNYLEKLESRIRARPRRFDRVLEIESPDARLRSAYFQRKLPDLSAEERRRWVAASADLTFAALAELIISVRCLGNDLDETVQLLTQLDHDAEPEDPSRAPDVSNSPFQEQYEYDGAIPY